MTETNATCMRIFVNAANNAAIRNNNQSGSWRVPDNLWREATPEQREIFNELRRREQANRRTEQGQRNSRPDQTQKIN